MKQRSEQVATDASTANVVHVPVKSIRADGGTQSRASLDLDYIEELKLVVLDGQNLPAIDVWYDGAAYWISDGFHRYEAYLRADREKIPCVVHAGEKLDAQWASYAANQSHGLRRSNADKERAVLAALRHPNGICMSDRAIAEHVGVSPITVGRYRKSATTVTKLQSETRECRDGRAIDTANIGRKPATTSPPEKAVDDLVEESTAAPVESEELEPAPADCPFGAEAVPPELAEEQQPESDEHPAPPIAEATAADTAKHTLGIWSDTLSRWLSKSPTIDEYRQQWPGPHGDQVVKLATALYEAMRNWRRAIK